MIKHTRLVLVAMGLTLAVSACKGKGEAERKAEEQKAQEATITAAKVEAEQAAKLRSAHADERGKLQKELDAHDRKAAYLKEKAAKTVGATKKNAEAAIAELDARAAAARASMKTLGDDASPQWDASRKVAEDDIAAMGKAVNALERTLAKK